MIRLPAAVRPNRSIACSGILKPDAPAGRLRHCQKATTLRLSVNDW